MKEYKISMLRDNQKIDGSILLMKNPIGLKLSAIDNLLIDDIIVFGDNYFECLKKIRNSLEQKGVKILCNGAKKNVYPSRMSLEMSDGVISYEIKLRKQVDRNDRVNIFDYAPSDEITSVEEQEAYYKQWIDSLNIL